MAIDPIDFVLYQLVLNKAGHRAPPFVPTPALLDLPVTRHVMATPDELRAEVRDSTLWKRGAKGKSPGWSTSKELP